MGWSSACPGAVCVVMLGTLVGLSACTPPWHVRQAISRQPAPPQVVSACAPNRVIQAEGLMSALTRLTPGGSKRATMAVLGQPAEVDSLVLADQTFLEVLTYETPSTVCQPLNLEQGRGLPVVFRNNALIGYGHTYYRRVILPALSPAIASQASIGQATSAVNPVPYLNEDAIEDASTRLGRGQPL